MGIKRYTANKDTTITNAYKFGNQTRATGSNIGAADSLEVFSLYGNVSSASIEKSRILVEYPIDAIKEDRNAGLIPVSGSASFFMKLGNVRHHESIPTDFTLVIAPVSQSWNEGKGIDLDSYTSKGAGSNGLGANWINAKSSSSGIVAWSNQGGDYLSSSRYTASFSKGTEDLEVDITDLVEDWIAGTKNNYGVGVFLTSSQEGSNQSYFTKKFSSRTSEYFYNRPTIEVRWDSTLKDNRGNFYPSSSALSAADNLNTVYFYNYVRGQLRDVPVSASGLSVGLYSDKAGTTPITITPADPASVQKVSTGIYKATFAADTDEEIIYDIWSGSASTYHTGTISVKQEIISQVNSIPEYVTSLTNLKPSYSVEENYRFRVYSRKKNWCPNIYIKSREETLHHIVEDAYFKVIRLADSLEVIPYGTGSDYSTRLSYDVSGSYFDLDMNLLEPDYGYGIKFMYYLNGNYKEQSEMFSFRVEK